MAENAQRIGTPGITGFSLHKSGGELLIGTNDISKLAGN